MRLAVRSVVVVPLSDPGVPLRTPLRRLAGPSKLAKLSTLKADTLGSRTNRSPSLSGLDKVISKVRSHARLAFPAGAVEMGGESAPSCSNCERETTPALTSAWPAG